MTAISDMKNIMEPAISGKRAFNFVAAISRYHRIQCSPGIDDAAQYCYEQLAAAGLDPELLSFVADGSKNYYSFQTPLTWKANRATLDVISDDGKRRIADYEAVPLSLVARSAPTPEGGLIADIVSVGRGDNDKCYDKVDVEGKIVLGSAPGPVLYEFAVVRNKAAGFITYGVPDLPPVRKAPDLPDAIPYWMLMSGVKEPAGFGFSLSRRQGEKLRQEIEAKAAEGKPLQAEAVVDTEFVAGSFNATSAVIEGETDEEVVLIAHICHPQPSANDNASGAGAALETITALHRLITAGALQKPKRSIRVLLVPEMTGTYAFLATNPGYASRCKAGLNLDMVGQDQSKCGSSLLVEYPPRSLPSFAGTLAEMIAQDVLNGHKPPSGSTIYPVCRYNSVRFSGGSDHYILSAPSVGIPCPMIIQWPDRYYHTSEDDIDKVDPDMLKKVSLISAIYCYFVATCGADEAVCLAHEYVAGFGEDLRNHLQTDQRELLELLSASSADADEVAMRIDKLVLTIDFMVDRARRDLGSLKALVAAEDVDYFDRVITSLQTDASTLGKLEQERVERTGVLVQSRHELPVTEPSRPLSEAEKTAAGMKLKLTHPGPIFGLGDKSHLCEERRRQLVQLELQLRSKMPLLSSVVGYWIDGERTLLEAIDMAELETGLRDAELTVELAGALLELGHVKQVE